MFFFLFVLLLWNSFTRSVPSLFKTGFSVHNIHLYLCCQVKDTKWILCCRKIGVKSAYLRFLMYKLLFIKEYFFSFLCYCFGKVWLGVFHPGLYDSMQRLFKTGFSVHNIHLYLCCQIEDTKGILCCQKIGVKCAYLRFLMYKLLFMKECFFPFCVIALEEFD